MNHIHICKYRYTQGNRPICGIYSLINGCETYKNKNSKCGKKSNHDIKDVVKKLWKHAINGNFNSLIGEFFSSEDLKKFINSERTQSILKLESLSAEALTITDFKNILRDSHKNIENGYFFIVPIYSTPDSKRCKRKRVSNNMHWICLYNKNNKFYIKNSANYKTIKKALKYSRVIFRSKSVMTLNKLEILLETINRELAESDETFNMTKFVKGNKKKLKNFEIIDNRISEILKASEESVKKSFAKSRFNPILVTVR